MPPLKSIISALRPLGQRLMRSAGIETADSMMAGVRKAFPGIMDMSREEFIQSLKAGKFKTQFAGDMAGQTRADEIKKITKYMAQGGKVEDGKLMQGMHEVHIPKSGIDYETKAFAYVTGNKVQVGGYMYRMGPKQDWVRAALYNASSAPKAVDKYSIAKVISAKMAHGGGVAPKTLSEGGARSYWDTMRSIQANLQHSTDAIKRDVSGFTTPGIARHSIGGGSRRKPSGGTG